MSTLPTQNISEVTVPQELSDLDKSIFLARHIKGAVDVLRPLVYKVWTEGSWGERFGSFSEYVESTEGLGMSPGYASKLKGVHEHYIVEGGLSPENIAGIDNEALYLARGSAATPEMEVANALTLKRTQTKQNKAEYDNHTPDFKEVCVVEGCWLTKDAHPVPHD